jgi:hypothetical protein
VKIEFLGIAQIPNDPYGLLGNPPLKGIHQGWTQRRQIVAVLRVTGSSSGIPNGIKPYDKSVLPYMRMLNGVNGVLQSENPAINLRALEDAMTLLADTEKNVAAGKQSVQLLRVYPRDFAEPGASLAETTPPLKPAARTGVRQ